MKTAQERYTNWLQFPELDPELREELEAIRDQPKEIEERFYTDLSFGTGGLRGILGAGTNRMNIYTVRKSTLGLASFVKQKTSEREKSVVIAYDCRYKSAQFAQEAALTLAKQGIKAYLYPSLRSTPQLSYSVRALGASAGIMITASHNPPEYNGYKVYGADGAQLNLEDAALVLGYIAQVENELSVPLMSKDEALAAGLLIMLGEELDQQYIQYLQSLSLQPQLIKERQDQLRIVFTPLHGTAYQPVQRLLAQAGFEQITYVQEQIEPDPNFSTVKSPNPEEHEAFRLAIQYAKRVGADLIMGTDPDADRLGLVVLNEQGEYEGLTGNQTGALLLHYILSQKQAKGDLTPDHVFCKTIVTSEMGRAIAASFGIQTLDTLTGFKFIGEKIKEFEEEGKHKFIFGYEESYGYLFGTEVRDKDALQIVLLAAEMALHYKLQGSSLYHALEQLYQRYGYYQEALISLTLSGVEGLAKIRVNMEKLRQQPPESIANQRVQIVEDYKRQKRIDLEQNREEQLLLPSSDVLKFHLTEDTWVCVRPSGTEPKLKIYIGTKASSKAAARERLAHLKEEMTQLIQT